jgi:deoxyadenosine/deoxycytidine kinase
VQRFRQLAGRIIAVEGGIGVGKTTAARSVVSTLNSLGIEAVFLEETFNDRLLKLFCEGAADKSKPNYAFAFQLSMLKDCQQNYERAMWESGQYGGKQRVVVVDRTVWGNAVFAALHCEEGNITMEEWQVYLESLKKNSPYHIDHVVYLDLDPKKALKRISQRGRNAEKSYSLEYLQKLDRAYYAQVYAQITSGHSNITMINNDVFVDAEYILRAITLPPKEPFPAPNALRPTPDIQNETIRAGFEQLCDHFTGTRMSTDDYGSV